MISQITQAKLHNLQSKSDIFTAWDGRIPGFGVRRQTEGGSISFILKLRINGKQKIITLGRVGILKLSEARDQAVALLRENLRDNLIYFTKDKIENSTKNLCTLVEQICVSTSQPR